VVDGGYDYSQPLVTAPDYDYDALAGDSSSPPPAETSQAGTGLPIFDQARQEFYSGDYQAALKSTDGALKEMPNDAVIHEFRALTLFALGKYQDAAATLYAVLSVGPGWDWTTMSGLYPNVATYTEQLRKLEVFIRANPDDPAARLVLAYHYLTAGHDDAAKDQVQQLLKLTPTDPLATQLLQSLDPAAEAPTPAKQVEPPKPAQPLAKPQLIGTWDATRGDRSFNMALNEDGTFAWKFSQAGKSQEVSGVWDIDQDGILALELDDESTMLAQVLLVNGKLDFYMLGDTQGSDPLQFAKS
jgi:tetratricopeptide (TPR) repeat protein